VTKEEIEYVRRRVNDEGANIVYKVMYSGGKPMVWEHCRLARVYKDSATLIRPTGAVSLPSDTVNLSDIHISTLQELIPVVVK
jgi:hypothetical protein